MVALAYGKSRAWHRDHCAACEKKFKRTEPRINGTCIFVGEDKVIKVYYHESCGKQTEYAYACQQLVNSTKE